jgi:hypothetical protein
MHAHCAYLTLDKHVKERMMDMRTLYRMPIIIAVFVVLIAGMLPATIRAAIQATFYAAPNGSGTTCSEATPCSLTGARDKVRTVNSNMSGDIVVYLRGGVYSLGAPFQLTESANTHDSGTNGWNVIYRAYPGETPLLSGGQQITGWILYDSTKNIYRANVGTSLNTRQLYVNGLRALRARGSNNPSGFTETTAGYTTTDTSMQTWGNPSDIEIVSQVEWKSFRCGIASISGTAITMKNPCWTNANLTDSYFNMQLPTWIENAYELLDAESEWYLNRATGYLYYKPRSGENLASATVIAPTLETLVSGTGTLDTPIHNIQFQGITFAYATWLRPSTNEGFAEEQANFTYVSTGNDSSNVSSYVKTPAAVTFTAAKAVRFERNTFTRLGSAGVGFEYGSQDNAIIGNIFTDISGNGIQIGDIKVDDHHPSDARMKLLNHTIANNYISNVAAEYHGGVGVFVGYTGNTVIAHNEITHLPYSGVSIGWGWGKPDPGGADGYTTATTMQNNRVEYNLIYDHNTALRDGGGIYTLGWQGSSLSNGTVIQYNVVRNQVKDYQAYYNDGGSRYITLDSNVSFAAPNDWGGCRTAGAYGDFVFQNNYWTGRESWGCGLPDNVTRTNNTVISSLSEAPSAILNSAGIEPAYHDIKGNDVTYSFADLSGTSTPVTGVHSGIDFGNGSWLRDETGSGWALTSFGYFSTGDVTARSFTLPSNRVLKSIKLEGTGTYSISDGVNPTRSGSLPGKGTVVTVATDWTSPGATVTITFSAGWGSVIDDITYGQP